MVLRISALELWGIYQIGIAPQTKVLCSTFNEADYAFLHEMQSFMVCITRYFGVREVYIESLGFVD